MSESHNDGVDLVAYVTVRVRGLLNEIQAEDIVLPSKKEKAQVEHRRQGRVPKHKGGRPPADYTGIEILVDLRDAMTRLDELQARATAEGKILTLTDVRDLLRELVQGYLLVKDMSKHGQ